MLLSILCMAVSAETTTEVIDMVEEAKKYVATAVYGDCLIDGELDDTWKFAQINYLTHVFVDTGLNDDPAQCRFRVMYDEQYLYFYVEVYDISMSSIEHELGAGNSWYNRDGVAFCYAPDGSKEPTASNKEKPTFWYILRAFGSAANYNQVPQNIFVTEKEGAVIADQNDFEKTPLSERMYFCKQLKDETGAYNGYVIECKVNLLARLNECKDECNLTVPDVMSAGMEIGFDMYLNDCDYRLISNNRDYGLTWGPSINSYNNNAEKGTIVLADKSVMFNDEQGGFPKKVEVVTEEETTKADDPVVTTADQPDDTSAPVDETTVGAPENTTSAPSVETTKADDTPSEKKGCGSSAICGVAVIAVIGTALIRKKH